MNGEHTIQSNQPGKNPYFHLIEVSPDGYIVVDRDGIGLFANAKAKEMLMRDSEEIIGKEIGLPIISDDQTVLELPGKDNSIRTVELRTVEMDWENKRAYLCNLRDITEHKKAEDELRKHKDFLEKIGRIAKIGGWEVDVYNQTIFWTHAVKMIHEVPEDYIPTMDKALEFFPGESKKTIQNALDEAIHSGKPYDLVLEFVTAKGRKRWVHTVGIPEMFNNKCIRLLGAFQDITELQHAYIELEQAKEKAEESDQLKTAFLANMSHEIRTPMNGIMGFANLLKTPDLKGEKQEEYIKIIEESGNRMLAIINGLIDISKIESNQMEMDFEKTNVNLILDKQYHFFVSQANHKGLELQISKQKPDHESVLITDASKFQQILTNLIGNAVKYSNHGTIEIGYSLMEDEYLFYVSDTGIGIDENLQEKIFERFRQGDLTLTRNNDGAGLGLSISKAFVEMLGGKIWLVSKKGEGTTFYFTLPLGKDDAEEEASSVNEKSDDDMPLENKTILVAEDDQVSFSYLNEILSERNNTIIWVENGKEAIRKIESTPNIDLVLMDIRMPEMNGLEATGFIKEKHPKLPVLIQTAFASDRDKQKAYQAGCDGFISKPFRDNDFFSLVNKILKNCV